MFCPNCGKEQSGEGGFCGECGAPVSVGVDAQRPSSGGLVGFSPKINDPAFQSYKKKSAAWSLIFSGILFVAAVIGFPIYGNASKDIEWPNSLYYGLGIGGMFVVIALLQTLKRGVDKTWDGVVAFKDSYRVREHDNDGHYHYHTIYVLKVKKDAGGTKKHKWRDIPGLYGYYNVGDRVRHHKGFYYYEKYDKSGDEKIMCAACMSLADPALDVCPRCKCPLLNCR